MTASLHHLSARDTSSLRAGKPARANNGILHLAGISPKTRTLCLSVRVLLPAAAGGLRVLRIRAAAGSFFQLVDQARGYDTDRLEMMFAGGL